MKRTNQKSAAASPAVETTSTTKSAAAPVPEWVEYTPGEPIYELAIYDSNGGGSAQSVEMTRDEFEALKRHLARLRGHCVEPEDADEGEPTVSEAGNTEMSRSKGLDAMRAFRETPAFKRLKLIERRARACRHDWEDDEVEIDNEVLYELFEACKEASSEVEWQMYQAENGTAATAASL